MKYIALSTLLLSFSSNTLLSAPITWEQWRGPNRDGKITNSDFVWPDNLKGIKKEWNKIAKSSKVPLEISGLDAMPKFEIKHKKLAT